MNQYVENLKVNDCKISKCPQQRNDVFCVLDLNPEKYSPFSFTDEKIYIFTK